jgi:uncharacterized protein YabN with tetrapyrrole methylase and pyrophosphatase domain
LSDEAASLTVVGLGINAPAHVTQETLTCLERADEVLYLVADPVAVAWLEQVNPRTRPLHEFYELGVPRTRAYRAMVDEILARVRRGGDVCVAFYGHAGVFVNPTHEAIRRAREEGFRARMLPAVSTEDCLFADLGIDPADNGCQSFEATDLLVHQRAIDPSVPLLLWQVGVVGNVTYTPEADASHVSVLVDYLAALYPKDHPVVIYEASPYAVCDPSIQTVELAALAQTAVPPMATLYLAPAIVREPDAATLELFGLQGTVAADAAARA